MVICSTKWTTGKYTVYFYLKVKHGKLYLERVLKRKRARIFLKLQYKIKKKKKTPHTLSYEGLFFNSKKAG